MTNQYLSPTHLATIERRISHPLGKTEAELQTLRKAAECWRRWDKRKTVANVARFWRVCPELD